jgi:hypothetical protein
MFAQDELCKALPPFGLLLAQNRHGEVLGYFLGLVVFGSGMKKRIIGINGAHLLQLGIQVGIGDVTMLLLLVGGFTLSGGLALGGINSTIRSIASASGCVNRPCSCSSLEGLTLFKKVDNMEGLALFNKVGNITE